MDNSIDQHLPEFTAGMESMDIYQYFANPDVI